MEEQPTIVHGCCPLDCQDSCAWSAQVQGGRVLRLEGRKDHPFTRGALCAKVHDYPLRVEAPDRLLQPLRRIGKKGAGDFVPISWDAALELIAKQLRDIVGRFGGEALLPLNYLGSMGVVQRRALMRVFHALGASRFHGSVCGASGNVLEEEGHPRGFDPEETVNSRFVLLWGCNMLTTGHHHWHFLKEARERHGTRIVCIDPIRTRTARSADEHVALRPGSDQVLAAAFGRLMLKEGWVDRAAVTQMVVDLDAYAASVEPWTPERAAGVTGVDAAVI